MIYHYMSNSIQSPLATPCDWALSVKSSKDRTRFTALHGWATCSFTDTPWTAVLSMRHLCSGKLPWTLVDRLAGGWPRRECGVIMLGGSGSWPTSSKVCSFRSFSIRVFSGWVTSFVRSSVTFSLLSSTWSLTAVCLECWGWCLTCLNSFRLLSEALGSCFAWSCRVRMMFYNAWTRLRPVDGRVPRIPRFPLNQQVGCANPQFFHVALRRSIHANNLPLQLGHGARLRE